MLCLNEAQILSHYITYNLQSVSYSHLEYGAAFTAVQPKNVKEF